MKPQRGISAGGTRLARYPSALLALLTFSCAKAPPIATAVLYSGATPQLRAALAAAAQVDFQIEKAPFQGLTADTVIVAGHSSPPDYLGRPAVFVAKAIAAFHPRLVVLDTCYGASTPILEALIKDGCRSWVVAPPFKIPESGLIYDAAFTLTQDAAARARLVHTDPPFPLLRWHMKPEPLEALEGAIAHASPAALRRTLYTNQPPLVSARLEGMPLLAWVPADRFKPAPSGVKRP